MVTVMNRPAATCKTPVIQASAKTSAEFFTIESRLAPDLSTGSVKDVFAAYVTYLSRAETDRECDRVINACIIALSAGESAWTLDVS